METNALIPKAHAVDLANDLMQTRISTHIPTRWKQLVNIWKDFNINSSKERNTKVAHFESYACETSTRLRIVLLNLYFNVITLTIVNKSLLMFLNTHVSQKQYCTKTWASGIIGP